tara:strand:- start:206 stop:514 length:309 start_codon:yes stop_codon:yes gene_type:complete
MSRTNLTTSNKKILNEVLTKMIDEIINTKKTEELLRNLNIHRNNIYAYEREITREKQKLKDIEKTIYKTCKHNWVRDWDDLYSRYKVCSKCKLANMPYVYNS